MKLKKRQKIAIVMGSQSDYSTMKDCVKILKRPVIRYTAEDTPVPVAPNLEKNYIPTIEKIVEYTKKLCN